MKQLSSSRKWSTRARRWNWRCLFVEKCSPEGTISTYNISQHFNISQIQRAWLAQKAGCILPRNSSYCTLRLLYGLLRTAHSCVTSPAWNFRAVLWAVSSLGLQPPSLWLKSVEISPASLGTGQGQTQPSFRRDGVLFLTFLQPLPNPFQQQSSDVLGEFLLSLSYLPFQWPFSVWKGQVSQQPFDCEKFIFLLNRTS